MKKSLLFFSFFILLFLYASNACGQHKYKVEYQIEVYFRNGTAFDYNFKLANFSGDTSGPNIFGGRVRVGPIETSANSRDAIISTTTQYSGVNRQKNSSNRFYDFCNLPTGLDILSDGDSAAFRFSVYEIESFFAVNDYSTSSNIIGECETKSLQAYRNSCGTISYGVEYRTPGNSTWQILLPYQRRSSSFSFDQNDFSGLNNYENLELRVQYNNTGTIEYSDVLIYSYVQCPPALNNTQPINVACFDADNGSVQLTFDRPLESGEQFRATLSGVTPENQTIPVADAIADTFGAGNTYDWINNLPAGDYTLTYQTFLLNDPNDDSDDQPTSTGETDTFTINRPTVVTVNTSSTTQPNCVGDLGSVTVTAAGGQDLETGTYEYSNNAGAWQTSPTFNNLAQGSSNVFSSRLVLSNGRFCVSPTSTATISINTITNGINVTGASVNTSPSYPGATDGAINIVTSGGAPNRTFQVAGPVTRSVINSLSSAVISNLPAGTYTVSVTDGNGCTANFASTVVLNAIPVPTVGTPNITTPISCFGDSDGEITIPITGGVTNYNFDWRLNGTSIETGTIGTSFVRSNLAAGNYSLIVSSRGAPLNVAAATDTGSITLSAPTQLAIASALVNDISCNGGNDGAINVNITGGTPPFQYRISNTGNFTNAGNSRSFNIPITVTGTYPLFIRDVNDCQVQYTGTPLNISEPAAITISEVGASHIDNTVNAGTAGELEIAIANNRGATSYNWTRNGSAFTPPAGSTDTRLINLPAGDYGLTVNDVNSCTASLASPIVITEPGPLAINALTPINVLCKGQATGAITATVTGTPPLNFVWEHLGDPGFTAPNQATITGLEVGTYTLRLTDGSAAPEVSDTIVITEPADTLDATAIPTNVSCFGGNDGSVLVSASGGTAPYTYSIDGSPFQTSNSFPDLTPATYTLDILDSNDCTSQTTATIIEPNEIQVSLNNLTDVTTSGGTNGAIDISIGGGTSPYTIIWSGPGTFSANTEDINGLIAGTYTLQIRDTNHSTDASGCYYIQNFIVDEPGPLAIESLNVTNVDCRGNSTGSIVAVVTGNAPINYEWRLEGNLISGANSDRLENIASGNYTLTVSDNSANPSITSNIIVVDEPLQVLSATVAVTEISCAGGNNGTIEVNAVGGTPPYEYAIDGGTFELSNTFADLVENTYTIGVRDDNGCSFTVPGNVFVNAPAPLGVLIDEQRSLTAAGANDGAISITPIGGTSGYTYSWTSDNGFTSSDQNISGLARGTYTVTIQDANYNNPIDTARCSFTSQGILIDEPGVLIATINQTILLECKDDDFAELVANVQGGVAPFSYQWFEVVSGSNVLLSDTTDTIGNLSAGEYFVRVTDTNSIVTDASSSIVTEPDLLEISVDSTTDILCFGDSTGTIAISVVGGTPPYNYSWNNRAYTTKDLTDIPAGAYSLDVYDANGCLDIVDVTINAPSDPVQITNVNSTDASAYLASDGAITLEVAGGLQPYTFVWTRDSDGANLANQNTIENLTADTYTVSITDANGCTLVESYEIKQPDIVEETIIQPICTGDSNGSISLLVNQGNGSFTYLWSTGQTTADISGLSAGSYSVTITGFGNGPLERTYIIEDPLPLEVDLGADRILCAGQVLELDVTNENLGATYLWTSDNGFTSAEPIVTITERGYYTLVVATPNGCSATGSLAVDTIDQEIQAVLAVSSQAFVGETVIAVDISYPFPDQVEWIIPEEAQILAQNKDEAELIFDTPGNYQVGMTITTGECIDTIFEPIVILEKDASVDTSGRNQQNVIQDFILFPNPTDGRFTAQINLSDRGNVSVKVFSFSNNMLIASEKQRGESQYSIPFDISNMPSGVYAVLLETPYGKALRKIVVK